MEKFDLKFKGPFSAEELNSEVNANCPGIYIWGFVMPEVDAFIPYYVGQDVSSVNRRISKEHILDILNIKMKKEYRRLSLPYMYDFFRDPWFPLYIDKNSRKFVNNSSNKCFDDLSWIKMDTSFYYKVNFWSNNKSKNKTQFLNFRNELDSLSQLINKGLFRAYFAETPKMSADDLNIFEALTKFSLQGKTSSMSLSIEEAFTRFNELYKLDVKLENVKASSIDHSLLFGNNMTISFVNQSGVNDRASNNLYLKKCICYEINQPTVYGL